MLIEYIDKFQFKNTDFFRNARKNGIPTMKQNWKIKSVHKLLKGYKEECN